MLVKLTILCCVWMAAGLRWEFIRTDEMSPELQDVKLCIEGTCA